VAKEQLDRLLGKIGNIVDDRSGPRSCRVLGRCTALGADVMLLAAVCR
jgi:hypothetical protein